MNIPKYFAVASALLICSGVVLATPVGVSWLQQEQALANAPAIAPSPTAVSQPAQTAPIVQGTPAHITVPSVGVDSTIEPGTYDKQTGKWTLSEDSAFFATMTQPANNASGNTFIYGHDSQRIFGNLRGIKAGAQALVTTDNGYVFTYTFTSSELVNPDNVAVLDYTSAPARLTLQTCPGVPNLTREMFFFTLTSYKKA